MHSENYEIDKYLTESRLELKEEELISYQWKDEHLQVVIRSLWERMSKQEERNRKQQAEIDELKENQKALINMDADEMSQRILKLENKVYDQIDTTLLKHQAEVDSLQMNFSLLNREVINNITRIEQLEEQFKNINITGGGDLDTLALEKRLTIFKQDLDKEYETIVEVNIVRENLEEIRKKVNLNEVQIGDNQEKIVDILRRLKNLEQLLSDLENALANKVDKEDLDRLYQLIANSSGKKEIIIPPSGPGISAEDLRMLKEHHVRIQKIEDKLAHIYKELSKLEKLDEYDEKFKELYTLFDLLKLKADKVDVDKLEFDLREKTTNIEVEVDKLRIELNDKIGHDVHNALKQRVEVLEQKLNHLLKMVQDLANQSPTEMADNSETLTELRKLIEELNTKLIGLTGNYNDHKKDMESRVKYLEEDIVLKLYIEDFERFKSEIYEELKKMVAGFTKKFADKNETKKALKHLERQIRALLEMIQGGGLKGDGEDAMLAKKPLGGWSCASCQKDLMNLRGEMAGYHPWSKFPMRDPTERLARVGHGFSRMLSMLKPDSITKYQMMTSQKFPDQRYMEEEDVHRMQLNEEEYSKAMSRTHPPEFFQGADKRPNTASYLPNVPHGHVPKKAQQHH